MGGSLSPLKITNVVPRGSALPAETATIQVFLVDRLERLAGVWDEFRNWIAASM
jgi:hypothetical protein